MKEQITKAVEKLKRGEIVAIPTETVYGLAAVVSDENAIKRIFCTKERPFFDPLIVHVCNTAQAKQLTTNWGKAADQLSQTFWPGPLTLVLPKKNVSDLITSGLPTVGIRCPAHEIAREIIANLGEPLAAPSANKFGKTSPSCAEHVSKEFGPELFVVDGGNCVVGIESTIVAIEEDDGQIDITVLRKGMITVSQIRDCLSKLNAKIKFKKPTGKIVAPGQVKHHYMPTTPILWVSRNLIGDKDLLTIAQQLLPQITVQSICELTLDQDAVVAAREFYSKMRVCSKQNSSLIVCVREDYHVGELWEGILDRLFRASTYHFLGDAT